jgi:hypothetical protein
MSESDTISTMVREAADPGNDGDSFPSMRRQPPAIDDTYRLAELEMENSRLHRLVAELLIKNQQLRKQA